MRKLKIEELIKWLEKCSYLQGFDNDGWCDSVELCGEDVRVIVDALKRADKYKWHDLRKNPNDLPDNEKEVTIANRVCGDTYITSRAIYEDGTVHSEESRYLYNDLDEFCEYCEETDDYIIQKGWYEITHFTEYYGFIDRDVVAWRENEPFEGGKE